MKLVNKHKLHDLILGTNGEFFSVVFTKKDGSDRHMVCRTGVSKGLTGVGRRYNPDNYGLVTVWCSKKKQHRNINLNTVKTIQINGEIYTVCNEAA